MDAWTSFGQIIGLRAVGITGCTSEYLAYILRARATLGYLEKKISPAKVHVSGKSCVYYRLYYNDYRLAKIHLFWDTELASKKVFSKRHSLEKGAVFSAI